MYNSYLELFKANDRLLHTTQMAIYNRKSFIFYIDGFCKKAIWEEGVSYHSAATIYNYDPMSIADVSWYVAMDGYS